MIPFIKHLSVFDVGWQPNATLNPFYPSLGPTLAVFVLYLPSTSLIVEYSNKLNKGTSKSLNKLGFIFLFFFWEVGINNIYEKMISGLGLININNLNKKFNEGIKLQNWYKCSNLRPLGIVMQELIIVVDLVFDMTINGIARIIGKE